MTKSWRDVLPVHPAAEMFPLMTGDELRELGEDIKKNGLKSRIALWVPARNGEPMSLLDGRNRLDGMEAVGVCLVSNSKKFNRAALGGGRADMILYLKEASGCDPYAYVISANIHRRHLTAEQKRDLIGKLLKANPEKSDRQLGRLLNTDHKTIGAVRKEKEGRGEISPRRTITDTKGRKQPAKKKTASPATSSSPAPADLQHQELEHREARAKVMQEIGESSNTENARLHARIEVLENQEQRAELENLGLNNQIEELKAQDALRDRYLEWLLQLPKPERIVEIRKLLAEADLFEHDLPEVPAGVLQRAPS